MYLISESRRLKVLSLHLEKVDVLKYTRLLYDYLLCYVLNCTISEDILCRNRVRGGNDRPSRYYSS